MRDLTLRRALAPEGDGADLPGPHRPRRQLGGSLPVHQRTAQSAGPQPFRRRARPRPHREIDAGARGRAAARRAHQRPRHSHPRNPRGEPPRLSRRPRFSNPRPLSAQSRRVHGSRARRPRAAPASFADYAQWEDWLGEQDDLDGAAPATAGQNQEKSRRRADGSSSAQRSGLAQGSGNDATPPPARKKLSYLEAREFAAIEQRVEASDARLAAARRRVEEPEIATDATALQQALLELEAAQHQSDALYARWAELTEKAG